MRLRRHAEGARRKNRAVSPRVRSPAACVLIPLGPSRSTSRAEGKSVHCKRSGPSSKVTPSAQPSTNRSPSSTRRFQASRAHSSRKLRAHCEVDGIRTCALHSWAAARGGAGLKSYGTATWHSPERRATRGEKKMAAAPAVHKRDSRALTSHKGGMDRPAVFKAEGFEALLAYPLQVCTQRGRGGAEVRVVHGA